MFDSTKEDLKDILRNADNGQLQLPDFQRDYVWGDEDVRSLIASIAKGFPVGALLTLQTGGDVSFKPRLLEGVSAKNVQPKDLLLDGQQRITSLYQSLFSKSPVRTKTPKNVHVDRFYYIDINKALKQGADIEDAIIGVPADRMIRVDFGKTVDRDYSTRDKEFENDLFPLNVAFDSRDWFYGWRDYWRARGRDVSDLERDFDRGIVDCIARYKMPIIRLDNTNSREAICLVFEKVNVGGKKLDAFELVTAIFAARDFDLRKDWNGDPERNDPGRRMRIIGSPFRRDVVAQLASTEFLQACTLLHTRAVRLGKVAEGTPANDLPQISCKRDALLALPLDSYKAYADKIEHGFVDAAGFANEQKIIWHKDIPYPPMMVALASVFAILGKDAQTAAAKEKLSRWFWTVTMGEIYGSATESKLGRDVPELVDWLSARSGQPRSVDEALFQKERLRSLRSRASAAYKGLHALMMREGCRDFITGRPTDIMTFFNDKIDIHHIFPEDWCKKQKIPPAIYNSIVNKTPLSKASNIAISGDAPSVYLKRIERKQGLSPEQLDEMLRTHLVDPQALRTDDFYGAFKARMERLADLVAKATGKPVVEESGSNEIEIEDSADSNADVLEDA